MRSSARAAAAAEDLFALTAFLFLDHLLRWRSGARLAWLAFWALWLTTRASPSALTPALEAAARASPRLARVVVAIRLERAVRRRLALALLLATLLPRPLVEALASAGAHFWLACDRRQLFSPTTGAHKSHLAFVAVVEYVALFLAHASARRHRVVEAAVRKAAERPWSFQAVRLAARLADERRWPRWTRAYPGLVRRELKFAAAASPFAAFRRALLPSVTLAFVLADAFDAFAARREVSRRRMRRRLLGGELEDGAAETPDEPSDRRTRGDVQTSSPSSPAASPSSSPSPSPSSSPSSSPSPSPSSSPCSSPSRAPLRAPSASRRPRESFRGDVGDVPARVSRGVRLEGVRGAVRVRGGGRPRGAF